LSQSEITFDSDWLNPHFNYLDEKNVRHDVWYLDGVTALNQMRAARALGISTFALWRLGSEDRSLWKVWDAPREQDAPQKLELVVPGQDVDIEGTGDILRISSKPSSGRRDLTLDDEGLITNEVFRQLPSPYRVDAYGSPSKRVVLSFDDGPDLVATPRHPVEALPVVLERRHHRWHLFDLARQCERGRTRVGLGRHPVGPLEHLAL
jgi:hypothetical protein